MFFGNRYRVLYDRCASAYTPLRTDSMPGSQRSEPAAASAADGRESCRPLSRFRPRRGQERDVPSPPTHNAAWLRSREPKPSLSLLPAGRTLGFKLHLQDLSRAGCQSWRQWSGYGGAGEARSCPPP